MAQANHDDVVASKDQSRAVLSEEGSEADVAEWMLTQFLPKDAEKPSKGEEDKTKKSANPKAEDDDENSAEDQPEDEESDKDKGDEDEDGDDDGEDKKVFIEGDNAFIRVKVGDEEQEVSVASLARLHGQEAALTKKSMEVAESRKTVEKDLATNSAATQALLTRAQARLEPYTKLDFNLLAAQVGKGELSNEEYQGLRQAAQQAWEDVQFLEKHLGDFTNAMQERSASELREKAKECLKVLTGPEDKGGIPGWDEKLYDEVRAFAVSQGADAQVVNSVVEPWAFRMMHAAMLHARGRDKGQIVTVKKNNTPKRIIKTSNSPAAERRSGPNEDAKVAKARDRMRSYGSTDDVAEFLLARHSASNRSSDD